MSAWHRPLAPAGYALLAVGLLLTQPSCYYLHMLSLSGLLPSSPVRIDDGRSAPSLDVSVTAGGNAVGELAADDGDHPDSVATTLCTPDSCTSVRTPYRGYNLYWGVPSAKVGLALDVTPFRCFSGFVDAQYGWYDHQHLYSLVAGFGLHTGLQSIGIRLDNALRLTRLCYDVVLRDEGGSDPDVRQSGVCVAPGYDVDLTCNSTRDFLFLRYYLGVGYACLRINIDVADSVGGDAGTVRTALGFGHVAAGIYRQQGNWRLLVGARCVREWLTDDIRQRYYWEFDASLTRSCQLPRSPKRPQHEPVD